jgi:hypothetical protein
MGMRTLGLVLSVALAVIGYSNSFAAELLIGRLPDISGTPFPITVSVELNSPTRWIRIDAEANIHGYDYPVWSCAGAQFHVTASCVINGVQIPWESHFYTLNYYGECIEMYRWSNALVDLRNPGPFTITIYGENELGGSKVAAYYWSIWTSDGPSVPVEYTNWGAIKSLFE